MAKTRTEIAINGSADDVWAVLADPNGIVNWMPGIESCEVKGDRRVAVLSGRQLTEQIDIDHENRCFGYRILDRGARPAIESHQGLLQVLPTDAGSVVVYSHEIEPDELAEAFQAASARALLGLKQYVEQDPDNRAPVLPGGSGSSD